MDEDLLQSRLQAMGKTAGPPWAEDQRICAAAAWMALADA
jgi:hypothetical protein